MSKHILWRIIKEQKEKIAGLKKVNRLLGERCVQLLKDKGELIDKAVDLQHKVDTLQGFLDHDIEYDMDKTIQELKKENAELKSELTKAKEIIKNLLILKDDHFGNTKMEWRVEVTEQAKQFIKDMEK